VHIGLLLIACAGLRGDPIETQVDTEDTQDTVTDTDTDTDEPVVDPGMPTFPDVIDVLHINILTGDSQFAGTDSNDLQLCLTATDCFSLDTVDWNDYERGAMDVNVFEDVDLPRSAVDRVEIRSSSGNDQWRPACIEMSFDGEPMYCKNDFDQKFGDAGGDELELWADPLKLHMDCTTCFEQPLSHGPMLGAADSDGARVWFRTDATRRVQVRVAETEDGLATAVPAAYVYPTAADDFTATVLLDGMGPSAKRFYDLEVEGVRHGPFPIGTTRTAGTPGDFRFAFGSCSKDAAQPIFASVSAQDLDLFIFAGDNHYANSDDLASLRQYYRWSLDREFRRDFVGQVPIIATWDDHDFTGNNTDGSEPGKRTALRTFNEYWANPSAGTDSVEGVFFTHAVGDIEFFVIDDRYWRGFDDTMLGPEQGTWLLDSLKASDATFKFLVSGSQWSIQGSGDSWAAFPEAQQALMASLVTQRIDGVVFMSGDVHRSEFRLLPGATGGYDVPELTSSPMATWNSPCQGESEERECFDSGDFYVVVDVDTTASNPSFTARILDVAGTEKASWTVSKSELTIP